MSILRRRPQPQPTYAEHLPEGDPQPALDRIKRANAIAALYRRSRPVETTPEEEAEMAAEYDRLRGFDRPVAERSAEAYTAFERAGITAHYLRGGHAAPAPTVEPTETVPAAVSADDLANALLVMRVGPEGPSLLEFLAMAWHSRQERLS